MSPEDFVRYTGNCVASSAEPTVQAAILYVKRNSGLYPIGHFDSGGRWFPDPIEVATCCRTIRRPSVKWKYSLLRHCYTMKHIARLLGVLEVEVKRALPAVRVLEALERA